MVETQDWANNFAQGAVVVALVAILVTLGYYLCRPATATSVPLLWLISGLTLLCGLTLVPYVARRPHFRGVRTGSGSLSVRIPQRGAPINELDQDQILATTHGYSAGRG